MIGQDRQVKQHVVAHTVKDFSKNCGLHDWSQDLKNYPYMTNVIVPDYPYPPVGTILIGCDNLALLNDDIKRVSGPNDPQAKRTPLGWGFMGPIWDTGSKENEDQTFFSKRDLF